MADDEGVVAVAISRRGRKVVKWCFRVVLVLLWLMVPLSFISYTSLGLGHDRVVAAEIVHRYFRVRWPGDGSLMIGGGTEYYRIGDEDPDVIDFAFRMFQPPVRRPRSSPWNRAGFWSFEDTTPGPIAVRHVSRWVGVPSILPPLGVTLLGLWWRRRQGVSRDHWSSSA